MIGQVIFLSAFFSVVAAIAATVTTAVVRTGRDHRARMAERLRWEHDFHDLPQRDRVCRHQLMGEFKQRTCKHRFDCRECETHAKLASSQPQTAAGSRMYHRGHTWVRTEEDGTVTVGLDDLVRRLVGVPDVLQLPAVGTQLEVNGTAWRMRKADAEVRVLSPVAGVVVETAGPESDWHLKVKLTDAGMAHLLRGAEVQPWIESETAKLNLLMLARRTSEAQWESVLAEMFLNP